MMIPTIKQGILKRDISFVTGSGDKKKPSKVFREYDTVSYLERSDGIILLLSEGKEYATINYNLFS